jgi:hypothetical protein
MKRLAFAIGLLVLGLGAATPASADFAVIKFKSGYCRIWTDTAYGPQDGRYLWFRHHWRWHPITGTFVSTVGKVPTGPCIGRPGGTAVITGGGNRPTA